MNKRTNQQLSPKQSLDDPRVLRQLVMLSVPAMVGLLVNTLYTMVDILFVGRYVGPLGIAALGISMPAYVLLSGIALMVGVGAASLISRQLGENSKDEANKTASTAVLGMLVTALFITVVGTFLLSSIATALGATNETQPFIHTYLGTLIWGTPIITLATVLNALLRAQGRAKQAMFANIIGNGINIILDALMIIGFGWGVTGAAIATIIGQASAALFALIFLTSARSSFSLCNSKNQYALTVFVNIVAIGFPTLVRQLGTSAVTIVINRTLGHIGGNMEIAAYSIIGMLLMFFNMPISGVVQGFQPLVGFHYGAKRKIVVSKLLQYALTITISTGFIFLAITLMIPKSLLFLFTDDQKLITIATPLAQIIMVGLPFLAILSVGTAFFQSIGKATPALVIWIARQAILLIPLILILAKYGVVSLFFAFPIADVIGALIVLLLVLYQIRKWNVRTETVITH